jgi:predicted dehydrogenase
MNDFSDINNLAFGENIKCGFIGFGSIARKHIDILQSLRPNARFFLLTNQEIDPNFDTKNITYLRSIEKFLECNLDFYVVTSAASDHGLYIEQIKAKNVPIIVEKPLSKDIQEAQRIIKLFHSKKLKPLVAYNFRFSMALAKVKAIIKEERIGEILLFQAVVGQNLNKWRPERILSETPSVSKTKGGGVLRELSHELDYLYNLFGSPKLLSSIIAKKKFKAFDVEDLALLHLCYDSEDKNVLGSLNLDFIRHDPVRTCDIIGANGTIKWNLMEGSVKVVSKNFSLDCLYRFPDDIIESYNKMWIKFLNHEFEGFCTLEEALSHLTLIEDIESEVNLS